MVNVVGPLGDFIGIGVTAHEGDACDHGTVTGDETVDKIGGQFLTNIFRQMGAVTARTMAGTIGEIKGECYLARNLLENDVKRCYF